jgi:hypothetical protein
MIWISGAAAVAAGSSFSAGLDPAGDSTETASVVINESG